MSRKRMMKDLELAGYAETTQKAYLNAIGDVAKHFWCAPEQLDQEQIRNWVEHLQSPAAGIGDSRRSQHYAALRFLYGKTLGKPELVSFLSFRSKPAPLPNVLTAEQVHQLLEAVQRVKYRTLFTTIYATGQRIGEACRLKTDDIDVARGVIHVRNGKGGKERLVGLPDKLYSILRGYWKKERPAAPWLFASRTGNCLRRQTAQKAFKRAVQKAGIEGKVTPHTLRHCFATHLLENGVDIRVIQVLLGHASIKSTSRYSQVCTELIRRADSPLNLLPALS